MTVHPRHPPSDWGRAAGSLDQRPGRPGAERRFGGRPSLSCSLSPLPSPGSSPTRAPPASKSPPRRQRAGAAPGSEKSGARGLGSGAPRAPSPPAPRVPPQTHAPPRGRPSPPSPRTPQGTRRLRLPAAGRGLRGHQSAGRSPSLAGPGGARAPSPLPIRAPAPAPVLSFPSPNPFSSSRAGGTPGSWARPPAFRGSPLHGSSPVHPHFRSRGGPAPLTAHPGSWFTATPLLRVSGRRPPRPRPRPHGRAGEQGTERLATSRRRPLNVDSAVFLAHQRQAGGGEGGSASPKRRLFTLRKGTSQIKLIKP